jgi:hypothetical protein
MIDFLKKNINLIQNDCPNCFVFKLKIENEYKICVCPRINDKWSESDIFYMPVKYNDDELFSVLDNELHDEYFNVIFLTIVMSEDKGMRIVADNPHFLKSTDHISSELYSQNKFFEFVEIGYQKIYLNKESENEEVHIESE